MIRIDVVNFSVQDRWQADANAAKSTNTVNIKQSRACATYSFSRTIVPSAVNTVISPQRGSDAVGPRTRVASRQQWRSLIAVDIFILHHSTVWPLDVLAADRLAMAADEAASAHEEGKSPASLELYRLWAQYSQLMYRWLKSYNCQRSTITCRWEHQTRHQTDLHCPLRGQQAPSQKSYFIAVIGFWAAPSFITIQLLLPSHKFLALS